MATTYWFTQEQAKKVIDRIEPQNNGCWHYPAKLNAKGYAATRIGWPVTKAILVHRLSWIYFKGDIPEGMVIDHLCHDPAICEGGNSCKHRRCVNPDHLQVVTSSENSKKTVRLMKFRTTCVNGHLLKDNLYTYSRGSACHTCKKEQSKMNNRKYRAAKVGA